MQWHLKQKHKCFNPAKNGAYSLYMAGRNLNKIYSWIEDWEPVKLQYNVRMDSDGVPHPYVEWCDENCKGKWCWYFTEDYAYISFEHAIDIILFKLKKFKGI